MGNAVSFAHEFSIDDDVQFDIETKAHFLTKHLSSPRTPGTRAAIFLTFAVMSGSGAMSASSKIAGRNWIPALYRMTTAAQSARPIIGGFPSRPSQQSYGNTHECKGRGYRVTAVVPCVTLHREASDRVANASDMSEQKSFDQNASEYDQRVWGR